jgi:similar to stage IV sporulation protein
MISLSLTRWLLGYARFSVIGGSPERFLNHCARSGINLWDIRGGKQPGACVAAGRYRFLHACARKAGSKLKVREKHGLPFATMGVRKRRGILAGAALFVAIIYVLSLHVWCIEVSGNTTIPSQAIEAELAELGVTSGTLKKNVEPLMLQQKLMLKFPQISWLSVNTRGCNAEVSLQEKTERPQLIIKDNRACNIKAASTGQIISLEVYTGTAQVKEGDAVVEGQLLISGVVENDQGISRLEHASGKIIAETTRTMTAEVELKRSVIQPTGKVVTRRSFHFFSACVPLTLISKPTGDYRAEGTNTEIKLMNSVLPIRLYEENWIEQYTAAVTLTREQALKEAEKLMTQKEKDELKDAKIISRNVSDKIVGSKLIYTSLVKCDENIARESEILIK